MKNTSTSVWNQKLEWEKNGSGTHTRTFMFNNHFWTCIKLHWLNGWFNHLAVSLVYGLVSWWLLYQKGFNLREWDYLMFWIFLRGLLESWHFNLKEIKKAQVISGSWGNVLTISSVFLGLNLCLPRQKEEFKRKNVDWYKKEWRA